MTTNTHLIKKGDPVNAYDLHLLPKVDTKPFAYWMNLASVLHINIDCICLK